MAPRKEEDPLMRKANLLRSHLPRYLQYRDDTQDDSGLEASEIPDGYGMTEDDYGAA